MRAKRINRQELYFYMFISPWLIGLFLFVLYPLGASLYYGFTEFDVGSSPVFVGLKNFRAMFSDPILAKSIKATVAYTAVTVPLNLIFSLGIALLVNMRVPGRNFFRAAVYLPGMVTASAMSLLWMWIFNGNYGILNYLLYSIHIIGPNWLNDPFWAGTAIILMSFWGLGPSMVIFLAALQNVPRNLVEASYLDGAGPFNRFKHVVLPMISPVMLFQLIMGIINSFQTFTQAFVMTSGGPNYATYYYVYYLYMNTFRQNRIGYASAMAWLLLVVVMVLSLLVIRLSNRYVYYEGGGGL